MTSQLDPTDWHAVIGDATVADAICDRLLHGAHRLMLKGESLGMFGQERAVARGQPAVRSAPPAARGEADQEGRMA